MTNATISLYNDVLFVFTPICCVEGSCSICYLYLLYDFHFTWCSCLLTITRKVPLVKQELSTLLQHLIATPVVSVVHVAEFLVFCVVFCRSLFLSFLLLTIVLHVLLLFKASDYLTSDYLSGTFKLFVEHLSYLGRDK